MSVEVPLKFVTTLLFYPETELGYQICSVTANGTTYDNVKIIHENEIRSIDGCDTIPFKSEDIQTITVTHGKQ